MTATIHPFPVPPERSTTPLLKEQPTLLIRKEQIDVAEIYEFGSLDEAQAFDEEDEEQAFDNDKGEDEGEQDNAYFADHQGNAYLLDKRDVDIETQVFIEDCYVDESETGLCITLETEEQLALVQRLLTLPYTSCRCSIVTYRGVRKFLWLPTHEFLRDALFTYLMSAQMLVQHLLDDEQLAIVAQSLIP